MSRFKIVETDNFGSDYPDEKFVNLPESNNRGDMEMLASTINLLFCNHAAAPRFWKVVEMPYELQGPFEP